MGNKTFCGFTLSFPLDYECDIRQQGKSLRGLLIFDSRINPMKRPVRRGSSDMPFL